MSSALVSPSRAADTTAGKSAGTAVGVGKSSPERMLQRQQTPVLEDGQALVPKSEGAKRKHSVIITTSSGEFDLNDLPPPRPGRPSGKTPQDPAMQEARKRARVLRNRAAAQLSREKKRQHLELLEAENADLRAKNAELERRLGKAEGANLDLSAKLDNLAKQLQDFQNLILGSQKQQQVLQVPVQRQSSLTPVVDWSSIPTPLAASPLDQPLHSAQISISPSDSTFSLTNATASTTTPSPAQMSPPTSSSPTASITKSAAAVSEASSILSAMTGTTVASTADMSPTPAMGLFPNVAASSEISGKGLSESAALEQSGAHIYCVAPDSQQRRPLPRMESFYRRLQQQQQQPSKREAAAQAAAASTATLEASSASSSMSWRQRMVKTAVRAIVSASAQSSPQALWMIFCALWWILCQNGGWISRHQLSLIARGILESPHQQTASAAIRKPTAAVGGSSGLASLGLVASWLGSGSRTAAALRRVVGNGPVDQVSSLVARLHAVARSIEGRKQRVHSSSLVCNKQKTMFYPP